MRWVAQCAVGADANVAVPPCVHCVANCGEGSEPGSLRHLSRIYRLKLSTSAFCTGLPGSVKYRLTPFSQALSSIVRSVNAGILSTTSSSGKPRLAPNWSSRLRKKGVSWRCEGCWHDRHVVG